MSEIKVGDYVRTEDGYIAKCIEIDEDGDYFSFDNYVEVQYGDKFCSLYDNELNKIVKHSPNIIDLIEVGDYVNGYKVVGKDNNSILILTDEGQTFLQDIFEDKNIKTVVTHEQFSQMEYKVKE